MKRHWAAQQNVNPSGSEISRQSSPRKGWGWVWKWIAGISLAINVWWAISAWNPWW